MRFEMKKTKSQYWLCKEIALTQYCLFTSSAFLFFLSLLLQMVFWLIRYWQTLMCITHLKILFPKIRSLLFHSMLTVILLFFLYRMSTISIKRETPCLSFVWLKCDFWGQAPEVGAPGDVSGTLFTKLHLPVLLLFVWKSSLLPKGRRRKAEAQYVL